MGRTSQPGGTANDPVITPAYGYSPPADYGVPPGTRGETMMLQPQWIIAPGMPAQHAQPDIPRELFETASSALPTFIPRAFRSAATCNSEPGWAQQQAVRYLLVPPDRFNVQANFRGGNRRGPHDIGAKGRFTQGTRMNIRRIPGISVGS